MAPLKDAVSRNRQSITDGSPRAIRRVPRGTSRGLAASTPARPATVATSGSTRTGTRLSAPHCIAPAATATTRPRTTSRRCSATGVGLSSESESSRIVSCRLATTTIVTATGTTTTRKTHRHEKVSASHPATGGPTRDGSTHAAEIQLKTRGRSVSG